MASVELRMAALPADAPRVLLSVRPSVWPDDPASPVRQEIDLHHDAMAQGYRVIGVARDLGTSATRTAPWKRKELGHWLTERAPEFDVLLFWKYDRFVRSHSDLAQMIKWCQDHGKLLVSVREKLDLSDVMGQFLADTLALVARIESVGTGRRVGKPLEYGRRQEERWLQGSPVYGYTTEQADAGRRLVPDPDESRVVRYMVSAYLRGRSGLFIAGILNRARIPAPSGGSVWQPKSVIRILRNPAVTGVRVMTPKSGKKGDTPVPVLGDDGRQIRVAEPLILDEDFQSVTRLMSDKARRTGSTSRNSSPFLGVVKHLHCGMNVTLHTVRRGAKEYRYLRCVPDGRNCTQGFPGVSPAEVYETVTDAVLTELGGYHVVERRRIRGDEAAARAGHLRATIRHYVKELAPGGQFSQGGFLQGTARGNLAEASRELERIDPSTLVDRWEYRRIGQTFQERWQAGGSEVMQRDLLDAGVTVEIAVDPSAGGGDRVSLHVNIPEDVEERLFAGPDAFASSA